MYHIPNSLQHWNLSNRNLDEFVGDWDVYGARELDRLVCIRHPSPRIHNRKKSCNFVTGLIHREIWIISRFSSPFEFGWMPNSHTELQLFFCNGFYRLAKRIRTSLSNSLAPDIPNYWTNSSGVIPGAKRNGERCFYTIHHYFNGRIS